MSYTINFFRLKFPINHMYLRFCLKGGGVALCFPPLPRKKQQQPALVHKPTNLLAHGYLAFVNISTILYYEPMGLQYA